MLHCETDRGGVTSHRGTFGVVIFEAHLLPCLPRRTKKKRSTVVINRAVGIQCKGAHKGRKVFSALEISSNISSTRKGIGSLEGGMPINAGGLRCTTETSTILVSRAIIKQEGSRSSSQVQDIQTMCKLVNLSPG